MRENFDWLFHKRAIGSKTAPNLLVLHPMERDDGTPEGEPTESAFSWYRRLAEGGWGISFVECTTCSDDPDERGHFPNGFLMNERNLPEFTRLVREIKEIDPDTVLMIQLSTGDVGNDGVDNRNFKRLPADDISRMLGHLIQGGLLAAEAGFDGMDLKLCHGHLPFQLLREANTRSDEWGGKTLKERARFAIEAMSGITAGLKRMGKEGFIIGSRISEPDPDSLRALVALLDKDLGMDFINVSTWPDIFDSDAIWSHTQSVQMLEPRAVVIQAGFTGYLANKGDPIEKMRLALESKRAPDFVGFGRQAVADPLTPKKLKEGRAGEINWCKRCNGCVTASRCRHYPGD